jgi:hypothetical protein
VNSGSRAPLFCEETRAPYTVLEKNKDKEIYRIIEYQDRQPGLVASTARAELGSPLPTSFGPARETRREFLTGPGPPNTGPHHAAASTYHHRIRSVALKDEM